MRKVTGMEEIGRGVCERERERMNNDVTVGAGMVMK